MMGFRDLRAFCRPPMGVPVSFAGVSAYADDGSPTAGLFDRPVAFRLADSGVGGIENAAPELRLPRNAFNPMPQSGDTVTVNDPDTGPATYTVSPPQQEEDGAIFVYELYAVTL